MAIGENYQNNGSYEGFIQNQLDAETISDKIAMLLRGYRFDPNERKYTNEIELNVLNKETQKFEKKKVQSKPILNEQGVLDVITEIRARIANVNASASLTYAQIQTTRHGIADVLWTKLRINREQYDLRVEDIKSVLFIVDDQMMLFLSRTEKGGFLKTLSRMIGRKEQVNLNVNEENKGNIPKGGILN